MEGSCFIKSFRWMVDEKKFKMLKWVTKYTAVPPKYSICVRNTLLIH